MQRRNYLQRYPIRGRFQMGVMISALAILALQILPIHITIGSPAEANSITRGSGR